MKIEQSLGTSREVCHRTIVPGTTTDAQPA
jgi:hypothetical protein